ncbi:propionyl-CoA synthetase [Kribbella sp. VKM Ac-2527]|uniref:Propionyl-CoA synthetase n=1 Tax=Kribbella caucasensis TaxID=2512215 RepID=A0A4R6KLA4_9ACTN|nr:AMP-binding protein [Kribbella sp. VKM Ac-2527]TDO51791.1 propionyl-CoA synthetase [Kribbella sp. VKM Ac-2527]
MTGYGSLYGGWRDDPLSYWGAQASRVDWTTPWTAVFDENAGPYGRWFPGGWLNTSHNCLDRHVDAGAGDRPALIWDSAMTGEVVTHTYRELRDRVAKVAGALAAVGVTRGDRVVIYMPMIPEAAIAMLACARLGAVHSVVFGGFAASELAARIDATRPQAIIAASCGLEPGRVVAYKPVLDDALEVAGHRPKACFVLQRPQSIAELAPGRDHDLLAAENAAAPHDPVPVAATDPLYILHTSGTTGRPKGIVRDNGGHAVALSASIPTIFGLREGDVYWAASDVGWVVGHSYIVYAPLLAGLTSVMYEGKPVGTPDAGAFWRVIDRHKVNVLFTAPTAIRAIRRQDPDLGLMARHDISSLQAVFLAGERCDPPTATWLQSRIDRPVIDNWWQTETGWPITARFRGVGLTPFKPGSGGRPSPGFDVAALDDSGALLPAGETGNLALRLPLPPGCAPTLWDDDEGYRASYLDDFPGWYRTGDAGYVDAEGDVWVLGRTDDIINVAGHRLSTGAMEEVLAAHPDVAECAVIGAEDPLKGEAPIGLVVLKAGVRRDPDVVQNELVEMVRNRIGAVASFRTAVVVDQLPKTRSGKILRRTLRDLANGGPVQVPPTIEDPGVVERLRLAFPTSDAQSVR